MTLRHRVAIAVVAGLSLTTFASAATAEPSRKISQTKKSDRSRLSSTPPPAPPAPAAPAPVPASAPAPVAAAPASDPGYVPTTTTTTTSASADPNAAPLPTPAISTSVSTSRRSRSYDEDDDRDRDREGSSSKTGWILFGVGTGLLATAWIATGATTAAICDGTCKNSETAVAWVPLAGPPLVGAVGSPSGAQIGALTASFITQSVGLTLMIVGLANTGGDDHERRHKNRGGTLFVAPQIGSTGMVMGGTF